LNARWYIDGCKGENMSEMSAVRRTKIVCTIGPVTFTPERIRAMILAGMDVARLNFSHGDHDSHQQTLKLIRKTSKEVGRVVGILQDLAGPKIRLGKLPIEDRVLQTGERVALSPVEGDDPAIIPVNYPYLIEDVAVGDHILLADGLVLLRVQSREPARLICEVLAGGVIQSHKGLNLPSSSLRIPAFTEKDREDLKVGLEAGVDFVALSFVKHEKDLEPVREILNQVDSPPLLIAKIERPQAVERLESIIKGVDGVMVARGDLGVEMPFEEVPLVQKRTIRIARQAAKPVITATQMLRSMINDPRPTRAEAADVANAILDGTDALMLSDETAVGNYPVEAVNVLNRIASKVEGQLEVGAFVVKPLSDLLPATETAIGRAAFTMAEDLHAQAIVAGTSSGSTARLISRFRPRCPVLGLTPNPRTLRQLTLSWGVVPTLVNTFTETDEMFELAGSWAVKHGFVRPGQRLVVTAGVPLSQPGMTNLLKVIEID
jgi:pyruvate kinase